MIFLFNKIYRILNIKLFNLLFSPKFKQLGINSLLKKPFRIDGGKNIIISDNCFFQSGLWLYSVGINSEKPTLFIGKGSVFGYNNHITCVNNVHIGNNVLTANNVYISDNLHSYEDINIPIIKQPVKFKKQVIIGNGAWVGENVCIIGASVGNNSVIGANSVVTRDIPDFCVAVGSPARVIKKYDFRDECWKSL